MRTLSPGPPEPDQPERIHASTAADGNAKTWRHVGSMVVRGGIARILKPATKQITARPTDPLSVSTSYVIMRNGIGVLGLALPFVLVVGGGLDHIQGSLSAYYHFSPAEPARYGAGTMRDAFVGMLCAIGAFLFFYRGHSLQEDLVLNVSGISAVLIGIFPMDWPVVVPFVATTSGKIHSIAAITFFLTIAYVCVFRARDTLCIMNDAGRRRIFERVYLVFGILMLATPIAVTVAGLVSHNGFATLIMEVGGVFVFAAFWLVKGFEIRAALHVTFREGPEVEPTPPRAG